jgi:hypothetical protein
MILQRTIHQVRQGKWEELQALEAKYDAVHARLGTPPRKRYQCLFGGSSTLTEVVEREWESLTALETAYVKMMADPELQALGKESEALIKSTQNELYWVL